MILQLEHISKSFGGHRVLDDLSLSVDSGEAVALLGANGAGKTTLLRIVTQLLEPDGGTVLFDGHPMSAADLSQVGYLPEERGLYRHSRAGEQAVYLACLKGMGRREAEAAVHEWFERLGIDDWWQRPVGRLSKGMQQRLQFIVTVAHSPRLLILDEPFSGFDEQGRQMLMDEIARLREGGIAVLLSTHDLQAASDMCNKTIRL